jgi:SAM-dependent methyltransferase
MKTKQHTRRVNAAMLNILKTKYTNWLASDHKLRKLYVSLNYHLFRHKLWREVQSLNTKDKFTAIYKRNLWNNEESLSGGGSTIRRTVKLRQALPDLLHSYNIKSICDAGCGDFNWMRHLIKCTPITYTGVDIVGHVISRNNTEYGNSNTRFLELDIIHDIVPRADLILCRNCLFHLSFSDIRAALGNFKTSTSMYLLTTHQPKIEENVDIVTGGCRGINWTMPPFKFLDPITTISEDYSDHLSHHYLALWRLDDIKPYGNS